MSTVYTAVPASAPQTITIPDDMDPAAMTILAAAVEGLADRSEFATAYLKSLTLSDALLYTGSAPAAGWSTDPSLIVTLPAASLTEYGAATKTDRDIVEVHASIELASAGTNEVRVALGWYGTGYAQVWDHTIRKTSGASSRKRFELHGLQEATGISSSASNPPKVAIFVYPQGADDALLYGPGLYMVRSYRRKVAI